MKQLYQLSLNGIVYGKGDWNYIQELMNEYVSTMNMYGYDYVNFKIEKTKQVEMEEVEIQSSSFKTNTTKCPRCREEVLFVTYVPESMFTKKCSVIKCAHCHYEWKV